MAKRNKHELVIFKAGRTEVKLRGDIHNETLWATQAELARLFSVDVRTINEHLKNIYKTKELTESATIRKIRIVQKEGKRDVVREVQHYNLDAILSVGYRVNSKTATHFRQWATGVLRRHITDGYTINPARIGENYEAFLDAVATVRRALPASASVETDAVLALVSTFAETWFSLHAYDAESLVPRKVSKKRVKLDAAELLEGIALLKRELVEKGEASEQFARLREQGSVEGIVGNVMQSIGGIAVYPSVEEKAAHLLYFVVKNHPFVDGNKRSGAYALVWFLRKAHLLDTERLTPAALTALTLLIAESDPREKDKLIDLTVTLLVGPKRGK